MALSTLPPLTLCTLLTSAWRALSFPIPLLRLLKHHFLENHFPDHPLKCSRTAYFIITTCLHICVSHKTEVLTDMPYSLYFWSSTVSSILKILNVLVKLTYSVTVLYVLAFLQVYKEEVHVFHLYSLYTDRHQAII